MTQATCMDEFDPSAKTVEQALSHIADAIKAVQGFEVVSLRDALDRVLAEEVLSPTTTPPCDNSAMDGYAFNSQQLSGEQPQLILVGKALAGHPFPQSVGSHECVRIMTGAKVPTGADTVVMQEHTEKVDEQRIRLTTVPKAGANIRRRGEDMKQGDKVLAAGKRLTPADLGYLASLGLSEVKVKRKLRVAFFSTGDELTPLGQPLAEGQIYDSNRYSLYGLLTRLNVELIDMGVVRDDPEAISDAFTQAASVADVLITSGGVSVGDADYVTQTLEKLGQVNFWKIAMKPGRPLAFGRVKDAYFFGLPGNPVSVIATFYQFVQPALQHLAGEPMSSPFTVKARLLSDIRKTPGRTDFQRGLLSQDSDGALTVECTGMQSSHIMGGMSRANCFIVIPRESGPVASGEWVTVQPFKGLTP